jgi:hypothetical protein
LLRIDAVNSENILTYDIGDFNIRNIFVGFDRKTVIPDRDRIDIDIYAGNSGIIFLNRRTHNVSSVLLGLKG